MLTDKERVVLEDARFVLECKCALSNRAANSLVSMVDRLEKDVAAKDAEIARLRKAVVDLAGRSYSLAYLAPNCDDKQSAVLAACDRAGVDIADEIMRIDNVFDDDVMTANGGDNANGQ